MRARRVVSGVPALAAWLWALLAVAVVAAAREDARLTDAVKAGRVDAVRMLLAERAEVNLPEADGTTALHWAARNDHLEIARMLLRAGARPGTANRYGVTPLSLAAKNGGAAMIRALLEAGADPNAATLEGETALMTAARTGNADAVRTLLDRGADVTAREQWFGETALMWAAAENHADATALLIERGADINARARVIDLPKVKVDIATMVITALPKGGFTPLLLAAREGAVDAARVLVKAGADLNLTDPDGTSPLVMAIINAHYDVAALLASAGANPDVADSSGMAAVYALVDMRTQEPMVNRPLAKPTGDVDSLSLLKRLLERGANPDLPLKTPLLARQHNFGDSALGEGATPLMRAAKYSDVPAIRLLLEHGSDPAKTTKAGANAAMFAARRSGRTRVPLADTIEAITMCLDRGADINAAGQGGETLLHIAAQSDDELVSFLASRGADLGAKDQAGRTPLDVALGVPGPGRGGRGGGPPAAGPVRDSTVALLRRLMAERQGTPAVTRPGP